MRTRSLSWTALVSLGCGAILGGCKESSRPETLRLTLLTSAPLIAAANTAAPPIEIAVRDEGGNPSPNQTVSFAVIAGGGTIPSMTATSDANGIVVAPTWKLGKTAVQQTLRASIGTDSVIVNATVHTNYDIVVRFWGAPPVSPAYRAIFDNAAARLEGIVTGDIEDITLIDVDLARCNVIGEPLFSESVDDIVIYVSVQAIDGGGNNGFNFIAFAEPCVIHETPAGWHTVIGTMTFDLADIDNIARDGSLQDFVTHEMLHVLGVGSFWDAEPPDGRNLIEGNGTGTNGTAAGDPKYIGTEGRQGCIDVGGAATCTAGAPLENAFGPTANNGHWRESAFGSELMTSILAKSNPLSLLTIRSLVDLGFEVNFADTDAYTLPGSSAAARMNATAMTSRGSWERIGQPAILIEHSGRMRVARP